MKIVLILSFLCASVANAQSVSNSSQPGYFTYCPVTGACVQVPYASVPTPPNSMGAIIDLTIVNAALGAKLDAAARGVASGVAPLDSSGKIPVTNLPSNYAVYLPQSGAGQLCFDSSQTGAAAFGFLSGGTCVYGSATVSSPSIGISISSDNGTLNQRSSITNTINVAAADLSSGITLSASGLPPGVIASFSPNPIASSGGTATLTLSATASATIGTYPVMITGTSGGTIENANFDLVVDSPNVFLTSTGFSAVTSPYSIPASFIDWKVFGDSPNQAKTGGSGVSELDSYIPDGGCSDPRVYYFQSGYNHGGFEMWTDGAAANSSSFGAVAGSNCGLSNSFTITDTAVHEVRLHFWAGGGGPGAGVRFVAHVSDNSSPDVSVDDVYDGNDQDLEQLSFTVKVPAAPATVTIYSLPLNGGSYIMKAGFLVN